MEGRPGFPSPPIAPLPPDPARSRTIQLLAAVEAPCGIHARRTGAGWALEPLPDLQVVGREGLDLTALGAALLGWLTGPDTPARFTVDLPATPRRTFFLPRKGLRRLVVYRLDQSAEPSELLLVPCDHRKAASKPGGYRELLARHAHLAYDERPVPSEAKTLRSWENLADALQHGLLICDGDLTIRYLNASAREHLSLDPASALGRRAADLPWDRETQEALLRLPAIPTEFHRQARMRRGQQWIPLDLNGRSLDGGGLVLECSFARLPLRHSGEYAPLGTVPPVAAPQPEPVWQGTCGLLPVLPRPGTIAHHRVIPLGGGTVGLAVLHVASDAPQWRPWAQQLATVLEAEAHPLRPAQEVLAACIQRANLPLLGELPWGLAYGRLHADHRTFDLGLLGDTGLLGYNHQHGWRVAQPDRAVYVGYGCPTLRLFGAELMPGEGLWLFAHSAGTAADHAMLRWCEGWPGPFPRAGWLTLRDAVQDPQPPVDGRFGGGLLLRQSAGVQEERVLFPPQFELYANTLRMRLKARGVDEHIVFQIRVALDEMLSNAFRHGHGGDYTQPIGVRLLLEEGCLRLAIQDRGPGFDPLQLQDPTLPEAILENGGRGIFLAAQMMDAVGYGESTNQVVLTKYFHPSATGPQATMGK